jgi:hypothetical protein
VSNTPLQSLTLLNDPTYVEAARAMAARILQQGGATPEKRIDFAYQLAFSRPATSEEKQVLIDLLRQQSKRFSAEPAAAEKLLKVGTREVPNSLNRVELAAWTGVARALFNKHEFIMRY